jgi:hypothetical protein
MSILHLALSLDFARITGKLKSVHSITIWRRGLKRLFISLFFMLLISFYGVRVAIPSVHATDDVRFRGKVVVKSPDAPDIIDYVVEIEAILEDLRGVLRRGVRIIVDAVPWRVFNRPINVGDSVEIYGDLYGAGVHVWKTPYYVKKISANADVKLRGTILSFPYSNTRFSFELRVEEIFQDPNRDLRVGDRLWVEGSRDRIIGSVKVGNFVEVYGQYDRKVSHLFVLADYHYVRKVSDRLADLTFMSVEFDPPEPFISDDMIRFGVTIINQGDGDGDKFIVEVYVDGLLYEYKTLSLRGQQSTTLWCDSLWKATEGTHTVTWVADPTDVVTESDETNNIISRAFVVGQPGTRKYAVVVGIDDDNDPKEYLWNAVWCAEKLAAILGRFDFTVHKLTDRARSSEDDNSGSKDKILEEMNWLTSTADSDDIALFYMYAHGQAGFIYAHTGGAFSAREMSDLFDSAKLKTRKLVIILECCYSGTFIKDSEDSWDYLAAGEPEGRIVITACDNGQLLKENPIVKHWCWSSFFFKDLEEGNSVVDAFGISVENFHSNLAYELYYAPQDPQIYDGIAGGLYLSETSTSGTTSRGSCSIPSLVLGHSHSSCLKTKPTDYGKAIIWLGHSCSLRLSKGKAPYIGA